MRCPLCSGPLRPDGDDFVCEVGHKVHPDSVAQDSERRLAEALWMAVQALNNEADLLRRLGDDRGGQVADEADGQARVLREFAHKHALRLN